MLFTLKAPRALDGSPFLLDNFILQFLGYESVFCGDSG
jgi:hypothetical protein